MRRFAVILAALLLLRAAPVAADMYPDASNAKLPQARIELGVAPQVSAESFGMKGDGVSTTGITTTAGSATFGGLSLTTADVGKLIWVPGAGSGGAPLLTTIASPTTFAVPATNAVPATWFASDRCEVISQGTGGYVPGDTVTMAGGTGTTPTQCSVHYTTAVSGTVANGGTMASPPPDGTKCYVRGTSHVGTAAAIVRFIGTIVGGQLTGPLSVYHGGAYTLANPPLTEPVIPENETCPGLTGATVNLSMGVLMGRRTVNGAYTTPPADPVAQASSSGGGTGATFNLTYTKSGAVQYGSDNLAGLQGVFAQTGHQVTHIPTGTYLTSSCARLSAASGISLIGDGRTNTRFLLPPECLFTAHYWTWGASTGRPVVRGLTLDINGAIRRERGANAGVGLVFLENVVAMVDDIAVINASVEQWGIFIRGASNGSIVQNSFVHMLPDMDLMRCIVSSDGAAQPPGTPSPMQNLRIINNVCDGSGVQSDGDRTLVMANVFYNLRKGAGVKTIGHSANGQSMGPMIINNVVRDSPLVADTNGTFPEGIENVSDDAIIMGNTFTNMPGPGITNFGKRAFISGNKCENTGLLHSSLGSPASMGPEHDYKLESCIRWVPVDATGTVTGNYSTATGGLMYGYSEDRRGSMTTEPTYVFGNSFVGKVASARIVNPATIAVNVSNPSLEFDGVPITGLAGNLSAPALNNSTIAVPALRGYLSQPRLKSGFTGTLAALYGYDSAPAIDSAVMPSTVYSYAATNPASGTGDGATSGIYTNYAFFSSGKSAAAGAGGTLNNIGLRATLGSGSSVGTRNRGIWIDGDGGALATNYAIYSESTARSLFAGPMTFSGLPTSAGAGGLTLCVDTAGVVYKKASCP